LVLIMLVHMFVPFMNTAVDVMGRADISTK